MKSPYRLSGFLTAFAILSLLPLAARAQGLDGLLRGTVKDSSGGALAGALVKISSPALMTGEQNTVSDEKGQWLFLVVPPGLYELSVQLAPKFNPYVVKELRVGVGEKVQHTVVLTLAGVTSTVKVDASAGLARGSGIDNRYGPDYFQTIPSRRLSFFSAIGNAAGVSPTSPSSGSINTLSVFGSAVNENLFMIDGTNFTCPCQGVSRAEPIVDVIQEVHVQSMGASVEFGNFQGGVINVVTRQGGARFAAQTSYYGQPSSLTAQPVFLGPATARTGYERMKYRDFTVGLGGPVRQNRLWFYGAYQYLRDYDSQPGANPAFPRKYENDKFFGKLNWRLTDNLHMSQSYHLENWVNPTVPTITTPFVATSRVHADVPNMTFAKLSHVLSNRMFMETSVGRYMFNQHSDPATGDLTTPSRRDLVTSVSSGNTPQVVFLHLDRVTGKSVLHLYQSGWLGIDHEFRVGTQIERGLHDKTAFFPGGVQYLDSNGPFQAVYRAPSITGGVFVTAAGFVSDSFTVKDRLAVDVGVRFDHSSAINPDMQVINAEGQVTDGVLPGRGTMYSWNVLSPRLGFRMKLDNSGHTVVRATYGRFNQGVLTGELDPVSQGATPTILKQYESATGDYTRLISIVDPLINQSLNTDMKTPHTDEFSVTLDRELTSLVRTSVSYVGKRGRDYLGWVDTAGQYRDETRTLANGTVVPVFVLTSAPADRRFYLTNPAGYFVDYDGLVIAAEKRMSHGWQASGSYTFSRAYGMQVQSNGPADVQQSSTIASPDFLTFGQDPNDLTNATGRLPNDRPHALKLNGLVRLPWLGLNVAANLQHYSGKPWAASTQVSLPQGSRKVLLETRGTRRLSSQTLLDIRVARTLMVGRTGTIDLLFDVLNALNDTAEEALAAENPTAATFATPARYIDPRRAMIGIRFNIGR